MSYSSESPLNFVYPDSDEHRIEYSVLDVVNVSWSTDKVDLYVKDIKVLKWYSTYSSQGDYAIRHLTTTFTVVPRRT